MQVRTVYIRQHVTFNIMTYRVRNFWGRVSYLNQSEARKGCFLASDLLKYETLPRKFRALIPALKIPPLSTILLAVQKSRDEEISSLIPSFPCRNRRESLLVLKKIDN